MKLPRFILLAAGMSLPALLAGSAVWGQQHGAYGGPTAGATPTALSLREIAGAGRIRGNSNPALQHFAGTNVRLHPRPAMREQIPLPRPVQVAARSKPFSRIRRTSTISPYLSLDVRQSSVGVPNYYAFVQPLLRQQATNQMQQKQFGQVEQQLRAFSANGIVAKNLSGGMPTTGHSTQFLNMGNYFPGR